MQKHRLKKGEWIAMSLEDKIKWKRFLQRRWRHKHPDWVKETNKHWADFYNKVKPYLLTCKGCGQQFNSARKNRHFCDICLENRHKHQQTTKRELAERKTNRKNTIDNIIKMWRAGFSQTQIAQLFGYTQSNISSILRRHNYGKKNLKQKK